MKKVIMLIMMLLFAGTMICYAEDIAVNDNITVENFMYAFNNNADAKKEGIAIVGIVKKATYNKNINKVITGYGTNNKVNIMINSDPKTGAIYEIGILGKTPSNEQELQPILMTALLVERTIGTPSGDGTVDGMFALIDAYKKGKGTYWCNTTNRRYIVKTIKVPNIFGFHIKAGI